MEGSMGGVRYSTAVCLELTEEAPRILYGNGADLLICNAYLFQVGDRLAIVEQDAIGVHSFLGLHEAGACNRNAEIPEVRKFIDRSRGHR